ncbi:queuosine salvage family protein [Capillimicrobium parvum]|uniref:Queuosine 5'-phosphate N-glycosylase/hydrolase n=1 Tax=Capillimicrobium parvum TaxID=2884022 RepID=A0A9E6XXV3_9ACTN|nr:queuosine salvage family protein [Capillimicrobium parvum]UGS36235.1 hypothetical protein DSM104329_02636 [Capillimicrobium parvum]
MRLCDEVRTTAAATAARATSVRVDPDAVARVQLADADRPQLDPARHYLEGSAADVATYLLTLDTINFGSGWFPTLRKRPNCSGYFTVAWGVADRFRAHGPWSNRELRAMRADEIADALGQNRDHELMALFAQALRQLGSFLGERSALDLVAQAGASAERLAELLASGMAAYADRGFYKRAQIVASDLALAGVARFADLGRLTIFADNLVPHVLRLDGVLVYDQRLAAHIDAERLLRPGPQEREIRACAVNACTAIAARLEISEQELDHLLWTRGGAPSYKAVPRHRCRTIWY